MRKKVLFSIIGNPTIGCPRVKLQLKDTNSKYCRPCQTLDLIGEEGFGITRRFGYGHLA